MTLVLRSKSHSLDGFANGSGLLNVRLSFFTYSAVVASVASASSAKIFYYSSVVSCECSLGLLSHEVILAIKGSNMGTSP